MKTGFVLAIALFAVSAGAEPLAVGGTLSAFSLEDQHGASHRVDASVAVVLFSRDMDGGNLLKEALADSEPGFLEARHAVYVADISGMPSLVARLFALPSMRKRPYPMLLDRDGEATRDLPDLEGKATLLRLDDLRITGVEHLDSAAEVREALGAAPTPGEPGAQE